MIGGSSPVAILDKEIANYPAYTIATFELCDDCGARFGIAFPRRANGQDIAAQPEDDLPRMLREMLREDHGHHRKHKQFTEIWRLAS